MLRKGFTLLELIVVIIIIGVLGSLGYVQYTRVMEKGRISEAIIAFSQMRKIAQAYYLENGEIFNITKEHFGLAQDDTCDASHYFYYTISRKTSDDLAVDAMRCTSNGKPPNWTAGDGYPYVMVWEWYPQSNTETIWCWDEGTCTFCRHSGYPTSRP